MLPPEIVRFIGQQEASARCPASGVFWVRPHRSSFAAAAQPDPVRALGLRRGQQPDLRPGSRGSTWPRRADLAVRHQRAHVGLSGPAGCWRATIGQSYSDMGDPYLFISITAVLVGGASLLGGSGNYVGTVAGVIILTILGVFLAILNLGPAWLPDDLMASIVFLTVAASPLVNRSSQWR